jgi:hypothetical protein
MTSENFQKTLGALLQRKPYSPFVVQLLNGERYEIDHPSAIVFREGVAVFIAPGFVLHFFDSESVAQVIDAMNHATT